MRALLLLALVALAQAAMPTTNCYHGCRFYICDARSRGGRGGVGLYPVVSAPADKSATPPICDKDRNIIGVVGSSGEARIAVRSNMKGFFFVPISEYLPGVPPTAIKAYSAAGIGHQVIPASATSSLKQRCVVLPLNAWQVLHKKTNHVIRNQHSQNENAAFRDCVAFVSV